MLTKLRRILSRYFVEMRWYTLVLALVFYATSSWLMLYAANEESMLALGDFFYWLVVTASTVGYGDLSPGTQTGKYIVSFYVIPLGLSIFAMVIGRIASWVSHQWYKGARGLKTLQLSNHIVVIGWNEQRTLHLLELLLKERDETPERPDIALCVRADIENPMPGKVEFVKVASFNRDEEMDRVCIANASVIVMDNPEDDMTLTTALYCSKRNPDGHKIAYFKDESLVGLLQKHCPKVECTPSVAVEMLAKTAFDPGSSVLHHDLISVQDGQAQYSAIVPDNHTNVQVEKLFTNFKSQYNATFIGYQRQDQPTKVELNPPLSDQIHSGDKVFYIARNRIQALDWSRLTEN